jgi:hypothetical protein
MKPNHKYFWSVVYDRTKNNCDTNLTVRLRRT